MIANTLDPANTENYNSMNPNNSIEERRGAFRNYIESDYANQSHAALNTRNGRFDEIYDGMDYTYKFQTFDLQNDHPQSRQNRLDAFLMMENNVINPLREAGRVKVYKGNPRKNW